MNQLATAQTYSMQVTEADIKKAMYILSGLPARGATDPNLTKAVYLKALEGVTRHSLEVATDRIIKGHSGLEHGFMPSPPELRRECERVMKPINEARASRAERERMLREQREEQRQTAEIQATWTPESRARATAKWQKVKAGFHTESATEQSNSGGYDTSKEASLARLKRAAENNGNKFNIDGLKSSTSHTFKQVGVAA